MIVDGKAIAGQILSRVREEVQALSKPPRLIVFTCNPTFETETFLAIKRARAKEVGIILEVVEFPHDVTTAECVDVIKESVDGADGLVVQLPFPSSLDKKALIEAVPPSHDVDALNGTHHGVLSPVIGAVAAVLQHHEIVVKGKKVVVVGDGMLVGRPAARWFMEQGGMVTVVTKETPDIALLTREADIILLGAGFPHLLQPDMIRDGVVVLDAGTSEEGGVLHGDADPSCAEKSALFTPVPGGIGPITVAILLQNLVTLTRRVSEDVL